MVESVKIYSIPQDAHTRYAHDTELSEGAFSRDIAASAFVSNATTLLDRGPKQSAFDRLFSKEPKSLVFSDPPPYFFTQLRTSSSKRSEFLFGSTQNLDSMVDVIQNVTNKEKERRGEQGEEESSKLTDVMNALKVLYRDRSFVYSKIGSLIQG